MAPSRRRAVMLASLIAVSAVVLSACADLNRLGQPETPYTAPPQQRSYVYGASSSSNAPSSFDKAHQHRRPG